MDDNIVTFLGFPLKRGRAATVISEPEEEEPRRARRRNGPNMHTFLFRSCKLILESDKADLVRDICFDVDKARQN